VASATSVAAAAGMNPTGAVRSVQQGDGVSVSGRISALRAGHVHHADDLVSLRANADGVADFDFTAKGLSVAAGPTSMVGRGLIIQLNPMTTKPNPQATPDHGRAER
jgi:Cu-Zn family superoxide dismutase